MNPVRESTSKIRDEYGNAIVSPGKTDRIDKCFWGVSEERLSAMVVYVFTDRTWREI